MFFMKGQGKVMVIGGQKGVKNEDERITKHGAPL